MREDLKYALWPWELRVGTTTHKNNDEMPNSLKWMYTCILLPQPLHCLLYLTPDHIIYFGSILLPLKLLLCQIREWSFVILFLHKPNKKQKKRTTWQGLDHVPVWTSNAFHIGCLFTLYYHSTLRDCIYNMLGDLD